VSRRFAVALKPGLCTVTLHKERHKSEMFLEERRNAATLGISMGRFFHRALSALGPAENPGRGNSVQAIGARGEPLTAADVRAAAWRDCHDGSAGGRNLARG
jgi:hypothetical protein